MASVFDDLSSDEKIQLAIATVTALAVIVAAITAWIGILNERKRTQPIVIAHEERGRHLSDAGALRDAWVVDSYVTSEGGGPAFNVRFGVEFHGVRYPYRLRSEDPGAGNIQRVLRPGERRPEHTAWPVLIDSSELFGVAAEHGDPDVGRVYWARYENAQGHVWETRNPADRSAKLDIHRVRLVRVREWREERRRRKAGKHGLDWERCALAELREGMDEARQAEAEGDADAPSGSPGP